MPAPGRSTWRWINSLGSTLAVLLIAAGYYQCRQLPSVVYLSPGWMRRVTDVLMLAVFPLVYATLLAGAHMSTGWIVFGLIVIFMVGGLLAFRANARLPLPKNLPPPLPDEDEDEDQ